MLPDGRLFEFAEKAEPTTGGGVAPQGFDPQGVPIAAPISSATEVHYHKHGKVSITGIPSITEDDTAESNSSML